MPAQRNTKAQSFPKPVNADVAREQGKKTMKSSNRNRILAYRYGQIENYGKKKNA